jgi:hypothetical protein
MRCPQVLLRFFNQLQNSNRRSKGGLRIQRLQPVSRRRAERALSRSNGEPFDPIFLIGCSTQQGHGFLWFAAAGRYRKEFTLKKLGTSNYPPAENRLNDGDLLAKFGREKALGNQRVNAAHDVDHLSYAKADRDTA